MEEREEMNVEVEEVSQSPSVDEIEEGTATAEVETEQETYKEMSPMQLVLRRFFRSKLSIVVAAAASNVRCFMFMVLWIYSV